MEAWTDFITALALLVAAVVNAGLGIYGLRKIEAVHVATNSKMDQLLAVSGEAREAKGLKQGRDEAAATTKG